MPDITPQQILGVRVQKSIGMPYDVWQLVQEQADKTGASLSAILTQIVREHYEEDHA